MNKIREPTKIRSLPPSVDGPVKGYLSIKVDEVLWCKSFQENVIVAVKWWGENRGVTLRPLNVKAGPAGNTGNMTVSYELRTNAKLFEEYLKDCEVLELTVFKETMNEIIGYVIVSDLSAIINLNPYQRYFPIVNTDGNRIGDLHVGFNVQFSYQVQNELCTVRHVNSALKDVSQISLANENNVKNGLKKSKGCSKHRRASSKCRNIHSYNALPSASKINELEHSHRQQFVSDSVIVNILEHGQKLRDAMVNSILEDGDMVLGEEASYLKGSSNSFVNKWNDNEKNSSSECKLLDFLLGKAMSSQDEDFAVDRLKNMSPVESLLEMAEDMGKRDYFNCENDLKCQANSDKQCTTIPELKDPSSYLTLNQNSENDHEVINLVQSGMIHHEDILNQIDSLRLVIHGLSLKKDRSKELKCVKSVHNSTEFDKMMFNHELPKHHGTVYFVEYELPQILFKTSQKGKSKKNPRNVRQYSQSSRPWHNNLKRFCSRKVIGTDIHFGQSSLHILAKSNISLNELLKDMRISFRIYARKLYEKRPIQIGQTEIEMADVLESETLCICKCVEILGTSRIAHEVQYLKVSYELGSEQTYFGNNFLEKLNKECCSNKIPSSIETEVEEENEVRKMLKPSAPNPTPRFSFCNKSQDIQANKQKVLNRKGCEERPYYKERHLQNFTESSLEFSSKCGKGSVETLLLGLLHIPEGRGFEGINTYLVSRAFWKEDIITSDICWATGNPHYNFHELIPVLLTEDLLERSHNNFLITEVWERKVGAECDLLLGIAKLPLNKFYIAYRDPSLVSQLLLSKYPVLGVDGWVSVSNPLTGLLIGQLRVVLALGTEDQIQLLEVSNGLKEIVFPPSVTLHRDAQEHIPTERDRETEQYLEEATSLEHSFSDLNYYEPLVSEYYNQTGYMQEAENFQKSYKGKSNNVQPVNNQQSVQSMTVPSSRHNYVVTQCLDSSFVDLVSELSSQKHETFKNNNSEETCDSSDKNYSVLMENHENDKCSQSVIDTQYSAYHISEQILNSNSVRHQESQTDINSSVINSYEKLFNNPTKDNENVINPSPCIIHENMQTKVRDILEDSIIPIEQPLYCASTSVSQVTTEKMSDDMRQNLPHSIELCSAKLRKSEIINSNKNNSPANLESKATQAHIGSDSLLQVMLSEEINLEDMFRVHLEIDRAMHLIYLNQQVEKDGESVMEPSTYVSILLTQNSALTNETELKMVTPLVPHTTNPVWQWHCDTWLPLDILNNNTRRLIFKVWQSVSGCSVSSEEDVVLGFAVVDLSVLLYGLPCVSGWFNVMSYAGHCNGQIKITVTPLENLASRQNMLCKLQNIYSNRHTFENVTCERTLSKECCLRDGNRHEMTGIDYNNCTENPFKQRPVTSISRISGCQNGTFQQHPSALNESLPFAQESSDDHNIESQNDITSILSQALVQKLSELDEITQRLKKRLNSVTNEDITSRERSPVESDDQPVGFSVSEVCKMKDTNSSKNVPQTINRIEENIVHNSNDNLTNAKFAVISNNVDVEKKTTEGKCDISAHHFHKRKESSFEKGGINVSNIHTHNVPSWRCVSEEENNIITQPTLHHTNLPNDSCYSKSQETQNDAETSLSKTMPMPFEIGQEEDLNDFDKLTDYLMETSVKELELENVFNPLLFQHLLSSCIGLTNSSKHGVDPHKIPFQGCNNAQSDINVYEEATEKHKCNNNECIPASQEQNTYSALELEKLEINSIENELKKCEYLVNSEPIIEESDVKNSSGEFIMFSEVTPDEGRNPVEIIKQTDRGDTFGILSSANIPTSTDECNVNHYKELQSTHTETKHAHSYSKPEQKKSNDKVQRTQLISASSSEVSFTSHSVSELEFSCGDDSEETSQETSRFVLRQAPEGGNTVDENKVKSQNLVSEHTTTVIKKNKIHDLPKERNQSVFNNVKDSSVLSNDGQPSDTYFRTNQLVTPQLQHQHVMESENLQPEVYSKKQDCKQTHKLVNEEKIRQISKILKSRFSNSNI